MYSNIDYNVVIYDWLSFTSRKHSPEELIDALGLSHCSWSLIKGAHGYRDRLYFSSISVHFNGQDDMGVWVEMSGQGCRSFEEFSTLSALFDDLFYFIHSNCLKITRLDVAYDDHIGVLDINRIARDVEDQNYISRMRFWEVVKSSKGTSIYIGSPQSKVRIRFYDKAAERGLSDGSHWIRVELQLRDGRAAEFTTIPLPVGQAFSGVLLNYLRFVTPNEADSNKSRWLTASYWDDFIGDVCRISIFTKPGTEYNLEKCESFVFDHNGNAVDALLRLYDVDTFLTKLRCRRCAPNPKYDLLVSDVLARRNAWHDKVAKYFDVYSDPELDVASYKN